MDRALEGLFFFSDFDFNDQCHLSHLQYVDDTILVGKATFDNLWVLRAVLRCFEMASGLKVNFNRSCLYGLNVSDDSMVVGSIFMCYKTGQLPFMYLGLPIGANQRKLSNW